MVSALQPLRTGSSPGQHVVDFRRLPHDAGNPYAVPAEGADAPAGRNTQIY